MQENGTWVTVLGPASRQTHSIYAVYDGSKVLQAVYRDVARARAFVADLGEGAEVRNCEVSVLWWRTMEVILQDGDEVTTTAIAHVAEGALQKQEQSGAGGEQFL